MFPQIPEIKGPFTFFAKKTGCSQKTSGLGEKLAGLGKVNGL